MTIASEITRLQWAKADARTSIINKGVDVPSSAKLDTYHDYIDLIQNWWLSSGIKLKWYFWYSRDSEPTVSWYYSWEENNTQYGLVIWSINPSSNNSDFKYSWVWIKHIPWSDIQYIQWNTSAYTSSRHTRAAWNYFIKNTTDGIVRGYFYDDTDFSSNWVWTFEVIYDYKNWTCTCSLYSQWTDKNLANVVTVPDWYEVVSWNSWIGNVEPDRFNNDSYFYITLK